MFVTEYDCLCLTCLTLMTDFCASLDVRIYVVSILLVVIHGNLG